MTTSEKLTMLKSLLGIAGNTQDTLLGVYLAFAQTEIINWRYGSTSKSSFVKALCSFDGGYASVYAPAFIAALSPTNGSYVFTYSETAESWQYSSADISLADYGVGYSGLLPSNGDTITVSYNDIYLAEYDMVQIMACIAGYSISGAENQTNHNENGIQRSFRYSDMVDYIHAHVLPCVGVI